jgi:subtilisin family serine protease
MSTKKEMIFASLATIILVAFLLWLGRFNISRVDAQNFLEEDEIVGLKVWGDKGDPNVNALLATQDIAAANISLSEVHLGYDKETGSYLDDLTITRHTQDVSVQSTSPKEGGDIDPSRIRFGSNYEFVVEPGIAPEVYEKLSNATTPSGTSGNAVTPYIVIQFNFPVDLETKNQLAQKGVVFGDPIDKLSFYAKIPPQALPEVNQAIDEGKVNFVGTTPPESRVADTLKAQTLETANKVLLVTVQLFETPTPEQIELLQTLMVVEGISDGPMHLVSGSIEASRVLTLAQQPFVQWVEEKALNESGNFKEDPNQDAPVIPANFEGDLATGADIVKQLGFDGRDINVAVMDTGIARQGATYHPDLPASQIVDQYRWDPSSSFESSNASDADGHGTHVAGSIGGNGTYETDQAWQGIAPGVDLLAYRICCDASGFGFDDIDFQASLQRAASNNAHVSNNSWGGGNGQYNTNAQLSDRAVRGEYSNQYMNMVVITHNDEALARSPGTAKNALTIGAVKDGNWPPTTLYWSACSDDNWPPGERVCFSNFGPIDADGDGFARVKPDIVAPGVRTHSTVPWYLSAYGYNYYVTFDGTSMAAPQVSGAVAQFLDAYNSLINWPEVVKAAFIVSATDVGGSANVNTYGRGILNAFHAIYDQANISDISFWTGYLASTGNTADHTFTVPSGFEEVRVALTWADPVSGGGSDDVVNDLDVRVYDGSGTQVGSSTTSDDTVEYVKVTSGTPGTWRIEARAYSISSAQYYGLASLVVLKNPDLSISGCTYPVTETFAGGYFYLYSAIANDGFAAPGSYVRLRLPNTTDYSVEGARIYTRDGRSHYYDDSELYNTSSGQYWRVALGEAISGYPRIVRWFLRCTAANCTASSFETQAYFRNAGSTSAAVTDNVTFSQCTAAEMPFSTYLPIILK